MLCICIVHTPYIYIYRRINIHMHVDFSVGRAKIPGKIAKLRKREDGSWLRIDFNSSSTYWLLLSLLNSHCKPEYFRNCLGVRLACVRCMYTATVQHSLCETES